MSEYQDKNNSTVINVIDEFDYSTQNDSYNNKYRSWRRRNDNPFSFKFEGNRKESIFVDGKGFVANSAEDTEKSMLGKIFYTIGLALLMWIVVENIAGKIIVFLLGQFGVDIHNNFFSSSLYGGGTEIVIAIIAISSIQVLVPLLFLHFKFKLPARVEFMASMNSPTQLIAAIGASLVASTIICLPTAYSIETKEIFEFFQTNTDLQVWDQTEFLVYTIFDIIVLSVMTEFLFHGAMFAVLRQFGDPFAIAMTAFTAAMLTQDVREIPAMFLISVIAGLGMIRSGSIFTAVSVNVIYKIYKLTITVLELDHSEKMPLTRNFFMLAAFAAGALLMFIMWLIKHKKEIFGVAFYKSEVKEKDRIITSVRTFPYSAVIMICVVYALIKVVL